MAFLAGSGNGTPPGVSSTATTSTGMNPEQLNIAQLMALMQQQQNANNLTNQIHDVQTTNLNSASVYHQLLLQNQLQQQQSQQQQQQQPNSNLSLLQLQQLAASLNQPTIPQQQHPTPSASAMNPAMLSLNTQNNQLSALLASLQQQQQVQQQQQQQQVQAQLNPAILSILGAIQPQQQQQTYPNLNQAALNVLTQNAAPQTANLYQNTLQNNDETKLLIELLLRQQQQQELAALVAAAASVNQTPRGSLSTQNSSNSLLGQQPQLQQQQQPQQQQQQHSQQQQQQPCAIQQQQHSQSTRNSVEAVYVSIPPSTSSTTTSQVSAPQLSGNNLHASTESTTNTVTTQPSRQTSSERLLASAQSVEDHIARLISENAAIVEPNPVLLKRRPYNRQNTSSSITSNTGNNDSSQGSPVLRSPGLSTSASKIPTTRSQSLHEPPALTTLRLANGSLTSGQPIIRNGNGDKILACSACGIKFANEIGLEMHQNRCGKKDMLLKQHSQPQLSINTSTIQQTQQQLLLHQQKLQHEHQSRVSALIGGGAGVAPDSILSSGTGRNSVPVGAGTSGSILGHSSPSQTGSSSSRKGSIQTPYPTERQQSKKRLFENIKPEDYIDVVTVGESHPDSPGSNSSNSASVTKPEPMDTDTAPTKMAKMAYCEPSTSSTLFCSQTMTVQQQPSDAIQSTSTNCLIRQQQQQQSQRNDLSPESKATRESVQLQLAFYDRRIDPMPYLITYANNDMPPIVDNDVNAAVNRRMLKTLTNCSKICDTLPHNRIYNTGESQFAFYKQAAVSKEHVEQLFQYLACYTIKPRINVKNHCIYTISSRSNGAHPNHSRAVPTIISNSSITMPSSRIHFTLPIQQQQQQYQQLSNQQQLPEPVMITSMPASTINLIKPNPRKEEIRYANNTDELESKKQSFPGAEYAAVAAKIKPISGGRSKEVEVYVRGRGRGRYVCDRCGIKCKKPSMLKKHLKSHTNIRPFTCITCNFAFKTKGNLTKHLYSKNHRKKLEEQQQNDQTKIQNVNINKNNNDNINNINEEIITNISNITNNNTKITESLKIEKRIRMESQFIDEDNENDEIIISDKITYKKFGQENIIYERETHTPPTLWTLCKDNDEDDWPKTDNEDRTCHSAPPVVDCETKENLALSKKVISATTSTIASFSSSSSSSSITTQQALPQLEPNIGFVVIHQMMKDGSKFAESVSKGDIQAQMQFTSEVVRMSRNLTNTSNYMLPVVKNQEVLEPITRKRPYPDNNEKQKQLQMQFLQQQQQQQACSSTNLSAFTSTETFTCDQCFKKFRKESELNLHKQTHLIEKQIKYSRSTKSYQCPECRTITRSKAVLAKHVETAHPGINVETALSGSMIDQSSSSSSNGLIINSQTGPSTSATTSQQPIRTAMMPPTGRTFICSDCNLGFRTHGVLAKHLRTKNHVKALCNTGKLPEDALTLIRDNSSILASVDASDCESAKNSLIEIVEKLRKQTSSSTTSDDKVQPTNSLECTEELSSISPTPRLPEQGFRQCGSSPILKNESQNGTPLKRPASEINNTVPNKRIITVSPSEQTRQTFSGNTLLGSTNNRYHVSDVWIPPKADDIDTVNGTTLNKNIDGNISDATSRSETSTPQHKQSISTINTSPMGILLTKCQMCEKEFENSSELQVHFQSEHVLMRDGSYYQCPNTNCEKVYPNKETLKNHLLLHYRSGTFIESTILDTNDEFAPSTNQSAVSPKNMLMNGGAASPSGILNQKNGKTANTAPKHSPSAPEESNTLNGVKVELSDSASNVKNNDQKLKCVHCNALFLNANDLQEHCATHYLRPHVCHVCDAGFTTLDSLKAHNLTAHITS